MKKKEITNEPLIDVMEMYLKYFNKQSVNNKMYGRLTCHSVIGGLTRHIRIKIGSYYDDNRINVFYVAPSGTGKTTGSNVYINVIEELEMNVHELDDFTDASIAGTVQYVETEDDEGRITKMAEETEGILEINDFVHSDEASLLLMPNAYSMKTVIFIQKACNPIGSAGNKIVRTLASGTSESTAECTFVFTTFPPRPGSKEVSIMVENGLLQRMAFYPRSMDTSTHQNMTHAMIDGLFDDDEIKEMKKKQKKKQKNTNRKELVQLISAFEQIREKYSKVKYIPVTSKFKVWMKQKANKMYGHLVSQDMRFEVRQIMFTYINRYIILIIKFATHNAIIKDRIRVNKTDLEYGWKIVFEMFKMSAFWIDKNLQKNYTKSDDVENSSHSIIYKAYSRTLKDKHNYPNVPMGFVARIHLLSMIKTNFKKSRPWFDENINNLVDTDDANKFKLAKRVYYKVNELDGKGNKEGEVDIMTQLDLSSEFH